MTNVIMPTLPQSLSKLLFILFSCISSAANAFDDSEIKHIGYPDWFNESPFFNLEEDLNKATKSGKSGLMVLFTTEGCSYCDEFIRKSLGDPEIAQAVQRSFNSIGMEIFDDTEMTTPDGKQMSIKQFAMREAVQFSPTLLFYSENGKRILRLTGYQSPERFNIVIDYVANGHYRKTSLRDFMAHRKATSVQPKGSLKADALFAKPPYMLDRSHFPASQPLLVIFEELDCKDCMDFHSDVLALQEVRDMLRNFDIVRLDANDNETIVLTTDGKKTTPAKWYEESTLNRVPAMIFFDINGNEVLKTDALVLRQRMLNSINYILEQAYKKGWTYQQYARSKAIEKHKGKNN